MSLSGNDAPSRSAALEKSLSPLTAAAVPLKRDDSGSLSNTESPTNVTTASHKDPIPPVSESETDIDESIPVPSRRTKRFHRLMRKNSDIDSDDDSVTRKPLQKRSSSHSSRTSERKVSGRNGKDVTGRSLLQRHCAKGNFDEVKELLESGADVNEADFAGNTPLHEAALEGYVEVVNLLLDHGADINAQLAHIDKDTPLIDAASNLHYEVVKVLLDRGANPCLVNSHGDSALDAMERDRDLTNLEGDELAKFKKLKKLLAQFTRDYKRQHSKSQSLGPGTDSEKEDSSKRPSQMFFDPFSREGRSEVYQKVAENDVTFVLNYVSNLAGSKISPDLLCLAAKHGHTDIASLLIAFGAKVNYVDKAGMTPLMHSVGKDHIDMVKLLLENKADASLKDKRGRTAMDILMQSYVPDEEEIKLLREVSPKSVKRAGDEDRKRSEVKKPKKKPVEDEVSSRSASQTPVETRVSTPVREAPKEEEKVVVPTAEELEARQKLEEEERRAREALEQQRLERKKARQQQIARTIAEQERKREEELRAEAVQEEQRKQKEQQQRAKQAQEAEQQAKQVLERQDVERKRYIRSYYPYGLQIANFENPRSETETAQYLPVYTFTIDGEEYLVDLQAILLLGTENFYGENSTLTKRPLTTAEKARVWTFLWPMIGAFLKRNQTDFHELRRLYEHEQHNFQELVLNWIKVADFEQVLQNDKYAQAKAVYKPESRCKVAAVKTDRPTEELKKPAPLTNATGRPVPLRFGTRARAVLQTFDRKLW
ncbi:hypothetical protein OGAPHI_002933 [Ogataea philodendri]|uniref:Uncharacterized protein n=1 Tax=Ogataea philodendri TaxID=1378263 RepID=A0A9P8P9A9_9ASCO|nr:uncharacterized protein OGAPHI_002933 [Ogataea philodendri]KAH3667284.1 hypothetical protein OGAPHI_002933 [Ogataea philodendri]